MKRIFLILAIGLTMMALTGTRVHAAPAVDDPLDHIELPSVLQKTFAGYYHFIEPSTGDTLAMIVFNPIIIYPRERFRNKAEEKYYWKTVRDIKKTYQTEKQKQAYLKRFEKELFKQYKPQMNKLTKNQGKMLIKLINRETNQSSYSILKAFLGKFRAGFWQTFSKFFGASLKAGYHPNKDKKDAMIERICVRIEQGAL